MEDARLTNELLTAMIDIAEEQIDVEGYKRLANLADELGMIELKMKMEEQAADEARHAELLTRLLGG